MSRSDATMLLAATHLRWVVDDLEAGAAGRYDVVQVRPGDPTPGVDLRRCGWWVPTGRAAQLAADGVDLQLSCVPPGWLADLPADLTGRRIVAGRLADVAADRALPQAGFVKPSTAKLDALPARWVDDLPATLRAAAATLPAGTRVEWTDVRLELDVEFRTFVVDGRVCRPSPYRAGGRTWEPHFDGRSDLPHDDAYRFASRVADRLHAAGRVPSGWVLDVGRTVAGNWLVVEANAAWSSGTYGCDLRHVVDAVVASSVPPQPPTFRWWPDPAEIPDG